jgi:rubredoxin/mono/diheme cytochrome c family protein
MAQYVCSICGYVHDEEREGVGWDQLPADWTCPACGAAKSQFQRASQDAAGSPETASKLSRPQSRAIFAHRMFGYVFLAIYIVLLLQMLPRLWTYQIEFPARTVVHISLGMAIGAILVLKVSVVRFFRRLEPQLVPGLGTGLLVGSVVLIGISVPSAFQEALATSRLFTEENRDRVQNLLAQTGLDREQCVRLAAPDSLRAGQRVLRQECTGCHDLRTVLAKPRTPENWRQTVRRMAERTTVLNPLEPRQQWQVTAYLIALSPRLQKSARERRVQQGRRDQSRQAAEAVAAEETETGGYDPAAAEALFESKCSQCHPTSLVGAAAPASEQEARELVARMVEEGLTASEQELGLLVRYLSETYVNDP